MNQAEGESSDNNSSYITISTENNRPPPPPLEVHQVCLPPPRTTFQKLKNKLREIFFPDDPLYLFKNQTSRKKLILGFQYVFPILHWAPAYNLKLFQSDLIAGLTIASLAIPQVKRSFLFLFIFFIILLSYRVLHPIGLICEYYFNIFLKLFSYFAL